MTTKSSPTLRYDGVHMTQAQDVLSVEAPLHMRINGVGYSTTMRTPGADRCLVRGLLFTEGLISQTTPIYFHEVQDPQEKCAGLIDVSLPDGELPENLAERRAQWATSSCGLCGVRDVRDIAIAGEPLPADGDALDLDIVPSMIAAMETAQDTQRASGGCHAAAAFAVDGNLLATFEDVGRHNAVDKTIGRLLETNTLPDAFCLVVSGRVSYEIVFKAFRACIPCIVAVSAPTSLAVEIAEQVGITVVGFCRGTRATVYSHSHRVAAAKHARSAAP